ncbi:MAG: methionyl-tRNA formyltransferase [Rhodothermaeota bacterium MED-G19]|jgi:methionyl-tRNA formyltransferase|nr:MAG: methionyl-tRNA formyltransferase [Rhodothermaeota bacterium MED-G19]
MEKKSILFMGTPEFAVKSLECLVNNNHNLIGVITALDKERGRGRKIKFSPVKDYALKKEIPLFQPKNLKDQNFIDKIKNLNADLFVVVAFRMLPKEIIDLPRLGCINLHASLLPEYRGAAPINWVIINGEKETGVTTFYINSKIDEGDIIDSKTIKIENDENAGSLHDKLMTTGSQLVLKSVENIFNGNLKKKKQKISKSDKLAPKISKDICIINLDESADNIVRLVNGLSPYPGARIIFKNKNYKILKAIKSNTYHNNRKQMFEIDNKIILNNNLGESIDVLMIQVEGKKVMSSSDFIRGNKI